MVLRKLYMCNVHNLLLLFKVFSVSPFFGKCPADLRCKKLSKPWCFLGRSACVGNVGPLLFIVCFCVSTELFRYLFMTYISYCHWSHRKVLPFESLLMTTTFITVARVRSLPLQFSPGGKYLWNVRGDYFAKMMMR